MSSAISGTAKLASKLVEPETENVVKTGTHELGKSLEDMTEQILKRQGYSTETRKRLADKLGSKHEIDVLGSKGKSNILAVECKYYAEGRNVGIEEIRNFQMKLTDLKIRNGLFVTNSTFSSNAEKYAEGKGLRYWDGHELREKYFSLIIGRLGAAEKITFDLALPNNVEYQKATEVSLANPEAAKVSQSNLVFHPYYRIEYRLKSTRLDPTKRKHTINAEGTYLLDGLDAEIINRKEKMTSKLFGFLTRGYEARPCTLMGHRVRVGRKGVREKDFGFFRESGSR